MARIGTVTADSLNIRPDPSTSKPPIGKLTQGQVVSVVGEAGDWYEIQDGGVHGYVFGKYLTVSASEPILIPDRYQGDNNGAADWGLLAADARYGGAILKATEGASYPKVSWFTAEWPKLRQAAGDRYGKSFFRGCYHYLKFNTDPDAQADLYIRAITSAGGLDALDLPPIVDLERGSSTNTNYQASAQQVVDVTSRWVEKVRQTLGRKVMLYGRGAMRDLGITSRMGCDYIWAPRYNSVLEDQKFKLSDIGWSKDALMFWQYTDGVDNYTKWPKSAPGLGDSDLSAFQAGGIDALLAFITTSRVC